MNLYGNPPRAIAGQKYGLQDVVESHIAAENVEPGAALFGKVGDDSVFNAHKNVVTLVGSADCVASNSLAVTVNGIALDAVAFATDMDTTLAAVVAATPVSSTSLELTMPKPLTVWITINCGKFFKRWEYQTTLPVG